MRQEDMIKFFEHVANRQASHGVKDAFRFKAVLTTRKKGDLGSTKYKDQEIISGINTDDSTLPQTQYEPPASRLTFRLPTVPAQQDHESSAPAPRPKKKKKNGKDATLVTSSASTTVQETNSPVPASDPAPPRPRPKPRPTGKAKEMNSQMMQATAPVPTLTFDPGYQWEREIILDPSLDPDLDAWNSSITTPASSAVSNLNPASTTPGASENDNRPSVSNLNPASTTPGASENDNTPSASNLNPASTTPAASENNNTPSVSYLNPASAPPVENRVSKKKPASTAPASSEVLVSERTLRSKAKKAIKGKRADVLAMEEAEQILKKNSQRGRKN
jgi:hypothetical protein